MEIKRSNNPLLSSIQDLIKEKYDLESWPSDGLNDPILTSSDASYIDVHVFGEESYVFTVGVEGSKLIVYRPGIDSWMGCENVIDLYNQEFLEELWNRIDVVISKWEL